MTVRKTAAALIAAMLCTTSIAHAAGGGGGGGGGGAGAVEQDQPGAVRGPAVEQAQLARPAQVWAPGDLVAQALEPEALVPATLA